MKKFSGKILYNIAKILILSVVVIISPAYAATLDELNQQKTDIQNSLKTTQRQIKSIQEVIKDLDSQTAATEKQIQATSQSIAVKNREISETQSKIADKKAELKTQKANLYEAVKVYYENSNQSTLETVVGSNSLSEAIDRTQYLEAISGNLNNAINKINAIMADLEAQNKSLEEQKQSLQEQSDALVNQQRNLSNKAKEKSQLLAQANNKEFQLQGDLDNVSEAIYAERQKMGGYVVGGTGGYPYSGASTNGVDSWGFYYRQCTSYAAWYFNNVEGKSFTSWRWLGINRSSNGGDWPELAEYQGYSVSSTPQAGAIASWPAGGLNAYGHVAIVRSVNSNGTINISEYNWVPYSYDERNNVSASGATFIY